MCLRSSVVASCGQVSRSVLRFCGSVRQRLSADGLRPFVRIAFLIAAVVGVMVGSGSVAHATPTDYGTLAAYSTLGVSVSTLFPIIIDALKGVLLPMIVLSLSLAVIYFLWSYGKSKMFGSA